MASSPRYADRVLTSSTTTGTGTYTLSGTPITGFRAFTAITDGDSCHYYAEEVDGNGVPSGGYEVGIGTVGSSGTTLTRDRIHFSSNSNAAVSWAAGTRRIAVTIPSVVALPSLEAGGRLTTESGVPISSTERSSQGTLYYTPYAGNRIALWDGNGWQRILFTETSLDLSTAESGGAIDVNEQYDVFGFLSSGALALELSASWTNDTTRADALTTQDGVFVKSGALTRRWLGIIRASGSGVTEDRTAARAVANVDNRVARPLLAFDATSHAYGSGTERDWDGSSSSTLLRWLSPTAGIGYALVGAARTGATGSHAITQVRVNGTTDAMLMQNQGVSGLTIAFPVSGYSVLGLNTAIIREWSAGGTPDFYEAKISGQVLL